MEKIDQSIRRRPRFRRSESPTSFQLTDRDVQIIRLVAEHRFLRSTHISQLLDAPHKKICDRLAALFHAGYLDRPRAQITYHVPNGGSCRLVYGLSNGGARLIAGIAGASHPVGNWNKKNEEAGREFITHSLMISDFHVALRAACKEHRGIQLRGPQEILASASTPNRADRSPWYTRVTIQNRGEVLDVGVVPDLAFAIMLPDGRRRPFVVECDRGTMPVERASLAQTSMLRKFLCYTAIHRQQVYLARYGWREFRVLTIADSIDRICNMQSLLKRTTEIRDSPLFLFATRKSAMSVRVLDQCWIDARGSTHSLA
jgi:hypothetical protein